MIIQVSQKDIELGERRSSIRCPVHLAIQRRVKKTTGVLVKRFHIYLTDISNWAHFVVDVPEKVRSWIDRYDEGQDVKPIRFSLTIPNN